MSEQATTTITGMEREREKVFRGSARIPFIILYII